MTPALDQIVGWLPAGQAAWVLANATGDKIAKDLIRLWVCAPADVLVAPTQYDVPKLEGDVEWRMQRVDKLAVLTWAEDRPPMWAIGAPDATVKDDLPSAVDVYLADEEARKCEFKIRGRVLSLANTRARRDGVLRFIDAAKAARATHIVVLIKTRWWVSGAARRELRDCLRSRYHVTLLTLSNGQCWLILKHKSLYAIGNTRPGPDQMYEVVRP